MRQPRRWLLLSALLLGAAAMRCGASADGSGAGGGGFFPGVGGTNGGIPADGGTSLPPPPEQEFEATFLSPVATGRFVWTANPESGRVARVDATTLEIATTEAGFAPTHLVAVPSTDDVALVLNVKSHDATLLRSTNGGPITTITLETHVGANAWSVSPGGRWAIAWTDSRAVENPDLTDGFQDVTVIDLEAGADEPIRLSVGYRPTEIVFANDESAAFAVTEPGVSVIQLDEALGPFVDRLVEVTDDPVDNPASRDVIVLRDGSRALVRREGSADIGVVDLTTGARRSVTLSGPVTDLDLSEDGTLGVAVVRAVSSGGAADAGAGDAGAGDAGAGDAGVGDAGAVDGTAADSGDAGAADSSDARAGDASDASTADSSSGGAAGASAGDAAAGDASSGGAGAGGASVADAGTGDAGVAASEAFVFTVEGLVADPPQVDRVGGSGEFFGSVSLARDGSVALLYTNAIMSDHVTLVSLAPGATYLAQKTVSVKTAVQAVFPSPDAAHAITFQGPGSPATRGAFSLVPTAFDRSPKIIGTEALLHSVAFSNDGARALVVVKSAGVEPHGVYVARLPTLQVDFAPLSSEPLAVGIVPAAGKGFVSQVHPEGRITFVDLETGLARTLTGFELTSKVVD